ncbi:hypothetical protein [Piscirickettsia salmonis]|uniref:hypothetical protein n=1 Tax=Piscirickettsia salmonis TaxID=1238 RepID=UPI001E59D481|nr:hypothetical protein [Piscirickettsia salmonis]
MGESRAGDGAFWIRFFLFWCYFKEAAWLSPYLYVKSHIHACKASINCLFNCYVNQLHYEQGLWKLYDQHQHLIAEAPTLILANASDATRLLGQFPVYYPYRCGQYVVRYLLWRIMQGFRS